MAMKFYTSTFIASIIREFFILKKKDILCKLIQYKVHIQCEWNILSQILWTKLMWIICIRYFQELSVHMWRCYNANSNLVLTWWVVVFWMSLERCGIHQGSGPPLVLPYQTTASNSSHYETPKVNGRITMTHDSVYWIDWCTRKNTLHI